MASLLHRSLALLRAPGNALAFRLRSRLAWSRGDALLRDEDKATLFAWLTAAEREAAERRERELHRRYDLEPLRCRSTVLHYSENVALLDSLERLLGDTALPVGADGVLRAVDVGCGAFQYATALQRFLARGGVGSPRPVVLRGLEVDGHGVYADGHSRADHARAHARLAGTGVHFQVADFTALQWPEQDVVTLWYPFLSRYALLQWGLPLGMFQPHVLLRRAVATLRPGGLLVVANQTETEYARLGELLAAEAVERVGEAALATGLVAYAERTARRRGSVWRRRTH